MRFVFFNFSFTFNKMVHSAATRNLFTRKLLSNKSIKDIQLEDLPEVSFATLCLWRNKLVRDGHITPKKATGRPKKHSPRDVRVIKRIAIRDPSISMKRLQVEAGVEACHQTMVKILKTHNLQSFKALRKPLLTPCHIHRRLTWANDHVNMDLEAWKRWSFSDESSVELDCSEGIKRFIIKRNQRLEPELACQ
jgi:transposase